MIAIFQSCLLPKMRLSVVRDGRFTGYLASYYTYSSYYTYCSYLNSELPDSPTVGNYGSSDEDGIVDLMKRTPFSSQGPGFKSKDRTYENLSLLP